MQFGGTTLVKKIHTGNEGLIVGINKLADTVGSTLGASGRTVIIEDDFGNPQVTKDGVTVAKSINLNDPVENLGVSMMKQASSRTATMAGDGTTTSTVLAQAIIKEYIAKGGDKLPFRDIRSGILKLEKHIIGILDEKSIPVNQDTLKNVSAISANNDKELGDLIADAFEQAGDNGVVTMETSQTSDTYIDVVEGTKLGGTSVIPAFYTNVEKETTELDNPLVFLASSEIESIRPIQDILEFAIKSNRAILLVAALGQQPLKALGMNKLKGNIRVNVINPPSFGQKQKDILEDIALLVGAKVYDSSLGDSIDAISPDLLGSADKAISDKDGTVLVVEDKPEEVQERIEYLRGLLDEEDHHVLTKHLEDRLALLNGGVARIFVGADTEVELKEKIDRVDDAIHAVKAAKKEGILPGGGVALSWAASSDWKMDLTQGEYRGLEILKAACFAPFVKIMENASLNPKEYKLKGWGEGVDATCGCVKGMIDAGIIDPTMVTKSALKNAVSVATTILSTDYIVSNVRE